MSTWARVHVRPRGALLDPPAAEGAIQISDDAATWTHRRKPLPAADDLKLAQPAKAATCAC